MYKQDGGNVTKFVPALCMLLENYYLDAMSKNMEKDRFLCGVRVEDREILNEEWKV